MAILDEYGDTGKWTAAVPFGEPLSPNPTSSTGDETGAAAFVSCR